MGIDMTKKSNKMGIGMTKSVLENGYWHNKKGPRKWVLA